MVPSYTTRNGVKFAYFEDLLKEICIFFFFSIKIRPQKFDKLKSSKESDDILIHYVLSRSALNDSGWEYRPKSNRYPPLCYCAANYVYVSVSKKFCKLFTKQSGFSSLFSKQGMIQCHAFAKGSTIE